VWAAYVTMNSIRVASPHHHGEGMSTFDSVWWQQHCGKVQGDYSGDV
jgi:hypothetical protein